MIQDNSSKKWIMIIGVVIAVLIVAGGGWFAWKQFMTGSTIKMAQYQAIFLTNGQVYFGKLSNVNNGYLDLTDVYYLQVQQPATTDAAKKDQTQTPQVSLAKLGSEVHGPEDQMSINRDQVLFWENLKDNGKVVEAIKEKQQQK